MNPGTNALRDELLDALASAGQQHLVDYLRQAEASVVERLVGQLSEIDLTLVGELRGAIDTPASEGERAFEPPDLFTLERDPATQERAARASELGARKLAEGRVGFLLVAGGQASRLGYDGPKGDYPLGPVTDRTLFSWHAGRIKAAARRHGFRPLWLVMTSPAMGPMPRLQSWLATRLRMFAGQGLLKVRTRQPPTVPPAASSKRRSSTVKLPDGRVKP